jgi:class 3 adenylate cyclase/tetratricopeptide (TPR) repeat protein
MIDCPYCATSCPDGSRFCLHCGSPLGRSLAHPTERRVVTVLFADLVGFTTFCEQADPEDADRLLREYYSLARSAIEAYGGVVEKFVGDAVVGVFGVPKAHEDDAKRAVWAALRLIDCLSEVHTSEKLQVRIGVNTGPALVRPDVDPASGQGFLVGDAVNTAARLQVAAPPTGVMVGTLTHQLSAGAFAYEAAPEIVAKGKAEPLLPWLVKAPLSRTGIDLTRTFSTPLVGREVELSILRGVFEKAVASSEPQFVLITGEAGIGKSRLVFELARHLDRTPGSLAIWRQGRALPYKGGVPYTSWAEIVREQVGFLESDDREAAEVKLARALPESEDREWLLARLRPLVGLDSAPVSREENFAAWQRFTETLAAKEPVVLVFEDLHWAGGGTLAFLEHLAVHLSRVPVLVIATARPEVRESHPGFATDESWLAVDLRSLSSAEITRLVSGLAGAAATEIEPIVSERCGGNPFFIEELVRLLGERPVLEPGGAKAQAVAALPDSLSALIAARLDTLHPSLKTILADAAVAGHTFWPSTLSSMGEMDRLAVEKHLDQLAKREFVQPLRDSSLAGETEYAFSHGLTREVAYGQLTRSVRAGKHEAVARWLETTAGAQSGNYAEILAHHYDAAYALAQAAGEHELAGRLLEPAMRALWLAGDRAMLLDVASAEHHYGRALRLCPHGDPARPALLVAHGESLLQSGDLDTARIALEEGLSALGRMGDAKAEAVATGRLASVLWLLGESKAMEVAARAVALLESEPPSAEQVKVLANWAAMCAASYDSEKAITAASRALALCVNLRLPPSPRALGWRGLARCHFGDAGGLDDLRRAVRMCKRQGLGRYAAMLYANWADELQTFSGPRAAARLRREGREFARRRGDQMSLLAFDAGEVADLTWAGRWDDALALACDLDGPLSTAGQILDLASVRSLTMQILAARGHAADPEVGEFVTWAQHTEFADASNQVEVLHALAALRLSLGRYREALSLLTEIAERRESLPSCPQFGLTLPAELRAAAQAGDIALARRLSAKIKTGRALDDHALALLSALEAEHGLRHEEAAEAYANAAGRWHRFGAPYEEAHALLGEGRCLAALGRTEASLPLRAAQRVFGRLGVRPAVADVAELLREVGVASAQGGRG